MKKAIVTLVALCMTCMTWGAKVNRRAVVERHRIVTTELSWRSPAQVGNGRFAMGVDVTGLQTFVPFNTMADWAWHSFPMPEGKSLSDYHGVTMTVNGRQGQYPMWDNSQPELSGWMEGNPHKVNLGRMALQMQKKDGTPARVEDLTDLRQEVDLWTGIVESRFCLEGVPVRVVTACHSTLDLVAVEVHSALIEEGRLLVTMAFPYAKWDQFQDYLGTMDQPDKHVTRWVKQSDGELMLSREMDDLHYAVDLRWQGLAEVKQGQDQHTLELRATGGQDLRLTCQYARENEEVVALDVEQVLKASRKGWKAFWMSGAAIDLEGSTDPRWRELERRIVLSQYVMRLNEAGLYPPQESGLVNNGWYGRHHLEMLWWHGAHYAYWDRWSLAERMMGVYRRYLPTSKQRAQEQGFAGARWPKCTGADVDREWPHPIHATLLWQQPHPIYLAECEYRLRPTRATLEKWADVIWETARFMADRALKDEHGQYNLEAPITVVSENTDMNVTRNPAFELGYWRYGLRMANVWRERMGLPIDAEWKRVEENLAPLPVEEGFYVTYEGIPEMWTRYNFEHTALIGTYGLLPGDGVDVPTMRRTLARVNLCWKLGDVWGWDFPMLAMCAARLQQPELAVDYLLNYGGMTVDEHGLVSGDSRVPFPYFPANGGLLSAIAMMAGGWDGGPEVAAPGFPTKGWHVRAEGFKKFQ